MSELIALRSMSYFRLPRLVGTQYRKLSFPDDEFRIGRAYELRLREHPDRISAQHGETTKIRSHTERDILNRGAR